MYKEAKKSPFGAVKTFYITDRCNLRCRYCYEENKSENVMSIEVAKKSLDFFLKDIKKDDTVIWDFIGGEPLLEVDLLEEFLPYMVAEIHKAGYKIRKHYFNFSTNGTQFNTRVKNLLVNLKKDVNVSVGVSLDGIKKIHDYNRSNSYDSIMVDWQWWRNEFPHNTIKATINHESLPFLFLSVKFFIEELKLTDIFMNTVFEDVWKDADAKIYSTQLRKIADYLLENNRYKKVNISLFNEILHTSNGQKRINETSCGTGVNMLSVDYNGDLYPCNRFATNSRKLSIGNVNNGIDYSKLYPFNFYHNAKTKCDDCEISYCCPTCTAFCFEDKGTIFEKTYYMCDMHKSRVDINNYFFIKIKEKEDDLIGYILD